MLKVGKQGGDNGGYVYPIEEWVMGHDSEEDARTCVELVRKKMEKGGLIDRLVIRDFTDLVVWF